MSKPQLILVHGMGNNGPGWEAGVKSKLEELAGRYDGLKNRNLWDDIELIPVGYDDIITEAMTKWQGSAAGVSAFAEENSLPGAGSMSWLDDIVGEDANFFWTHLADVVIYYFFKLYRDRIRASVAKQIVEPLIDRPVAERGFDRATIVAHSLGSSVTHDTLHLLGTTAFAGYANAFSPPTERFRAIFTLANVSRVLQTDIKAYRSIVRPGPRNNVESNCSRFYNYRHDVDPFCVVKRFDPEDFHSQLYRHRVLTHYRHWNLHSFDHYLDHPRVHVRLFNTVYGSSVIKRSEFIDAVKDENYPQFAGDFQDVRELREKVGELGAVVHALGEDAAFEDLLMAIAKAHGILGEIKGIIDTLNGGGQ